MITVIALFADERVDNSVPAERRLERRLVREGASEVESAREALGNDGDESK